MTLINITTKVVGSDTYNERKILASDLNQIKGAIQTGTYDIAPNDIAMQGTTITANSGLNLIRYNTGTNKAELNDVGVWKVPVYTADSEGISITAGENLAIRDVVYISTTDGKAYKCDADDPTKLDWIGVMAEAVLMNNTGRCYTDGNTVGGFTGLTTGEWYELSSTAGAITIGFDNKVGVAISTTQIKITKTDGSFSDSFALSSALSFILDGVTATNQNNLIRHSNLTYTNFNTSILINNTGYAYYDTLVGIYGGESYDNYDGSVDGTKWVISGSGVSSETANVHVQRFRAFAIGDSNVSVRADTLNLKPQSGTKSSCVVKVYIYGQADSQTEARFYLYDGTNIVDIENLNLSAGNKTIDGLFRLELDTVTNICTVYKNGTLFASPSISTLTGSNWKLVATATGNTSGGANQSETLARFYPVIYTNGSTLSATMESTTSSYTMPITASRFIINDYSTTTNSLVDISFDGTLFQDALMRSVRKITNTGTSLKLKYTYSGLHTQMQISKSLLFYK